MLQIVKEDEARKIKIKRIRKEIFARRAGSYIGGKLEQHHTAFARCDEPISQVMVNLVIDDNQSSK